MPEDLCDECGALSALKLKPDGLKLTNSCSLEDGHSQVAFNADSDLLQPTKVTLGLLYVRLLGIDWGNVTSLNFTSLFLDDFLS
jgi:hypothetical protein